MSDTKPLKKQRQRAPSKRSLESRGRIVDAAERVFARGGFAGATIRDIAAEADVPLGLVNHHGGSKEDLFREVIARRADELSALRIAALEAVQGTPTLRTLLECFIGPYIEKAKSGPQWLAYARLVALVSADPERRDISTDLFDPTAQRFIREIAALYPEAPMAAVAEGFIYSVSAMLALLTSRWRIGALSGDAAADGDLNGLLDFCAAGFAARLSVKA